MDSFIVFGQPSITQEDIQAVGDTMKTRWIGYGPKSREFEALFSKHTNRKHAIALNSCTSALFLSLKFSGVGHGDEVITTAITFAGVANTIIHAGGTPVFVDVDPVTHNTTAEIIAKAITPKTRAIIIVHLAGRPCEMDDIVRLARDRNCVLIEDCAHAIEATYKGKPCGSFGDFACYSFYPNKNITTGEGGMLVLDDDMSAAKARVLSLHGLSKDASRRFDKNHRNFYEVEEHGYKMNMNDMAAALGVSQYKRLSIMRARRELIWKSYMEELSDIPEIIAPAPIPDTMEHAYHLFSILFDLDRMTINRNDFAVILKDRNIGTGIHYLAIHLQKAFLRNDGAAPNLPHAQYISERTISLPSQPSLEKEHIDYIIATVHDVIREYKK